MPGSSGGYVRASPSPHSSGVPAISPPSSISQCICPCPPPPEGSSLDSVPWGARASWRVKGMGQTLQGKPQFAPQPRWSYYSLHKKTLCFPPTSVSTLLESNGSLQIKLIIGEKKQSSFSLGFSISPTVNTNLETLGLYKLQAQIHFPHQWVVGATGAPWRDSGPELPFQPCQLHSWRCE